MGNRYQCLKRRITADKREIEDFPKLPSATSFIRKTLAAISTYSAHHKEAKMLERLKASPWIQTLTTVISGLVGIVIGVIVERTFLDRMFDTPTSALLLCFAVLYLVFIAAMTAVGIFAKRSEQQVQAVSKRLESIDWKLGLTVEFIYDPPPGTGESYRRAAEIVEKARDSICVLAHSVKRPREQREARERLLSERFKQARADYEQALCKKIEEHKDKQYFYKRVVQFEGDEEQWELTEEWLSKWMAEHCQHLLEEMNRYDSVILKMAPPFFPHTYVIVDDRYVILAFDGYDPDTRSHGMDGVLIFHDPHGTFVRYLREFFNKVDAHGVIPK